MPSVMPVAEPGNDFLDFARFFLLCIKFYPWNCWSQILNVSAYFSMIWSLKTTFWECVDNFEGIRTSVEGFGIQNCEDLVRMGGCDRGGAAFCCACSESVEGISSVFLSWGRLLLALPPSAFFPPKAVIFFLLTWIRIVSDATDLTHKQSWVPLNIFRTL